MAMIAERRREPTATAAWWQRMLERYPKDAFAHFVYADSLAKHAKYNEAITAFEHSFALMKKPRLTDMLDSIAQIFLIQENHFGAINAYNRMLRILAEDWHLTEGKTVEGYRQNIALLEKRY